MTVEGAQAIDSQGMLAATAALPEQVAAAAERAAGVSGLPSVDDVNSVVVLGMGGSGIAGDIMASVAGPFMPVPVLVAKSYELPAFVGEGTLVFAVSFSGNTEETVEATTEAAVQGAKIVVVSGKPYDSILGRPAYASELCEAVGTPGDLVLIVPNQPIARLRAGPSGKVVVRSESAAGETIAPPTPCRARAATRTHEARANPPASEAAENRARPATKTRRRPNRSAARPPSIRNPPKVRA